MDWLPEPDAGTDVTLSFDGSDVNDWTVIGAETDAQGRPLLTTRPDGVVAWRALVTVPGDAAPHGSHDVDFRLLDTSGARIAAHDSVFVGPGRP